VKRPSVAHVLATWFGCGHVPYAPGTAGTLGAVPLYLLLRPLGHLGVLTAALLITAIGLWAADVVAKDLGTKDPQIVVIDEVAGVLLTLSVAPPTWSALAAGVILFRFFDQTKPWPARTAERRLPGGWGIVLDDVAAGIWGAAGLAGLKVAGLV
jgi:phosphatidylglycerophosphatase A